jgi:L-alanine-DL-glutamate epimerase-like enolase superfamily enzyme
MKITKIRIRGVNIPLIKPYTVAVVGTIETTRSVVVELFTDQGTVGVGETDPELMFTGESQGTVMIVLRDHIGPAVLGMDPFDLETIHTRMEAMSVGNYFAKAAIDLACHDIQGKFLNIPVYKLLGGAVQERISIMWSLGSDSVESNVRDALKKAEEGYGTIGLKVGNLPPEQDVERVRAVRKAVGDGVLIRCDANQAWTPPVAISTIRRLEESNIAMIEQPVPAWDVEGMAEVRASVGIPVGVDEGLCSPHDALRLVQARAADFFSIKTTKLGGILPSRKVVAIVETAGGKIFVNSMIEMGISVMSGLNFAVSARNLFPIGHALTSVRRLKDDIIQNPVPYEGTEILAPTDRVGLGVELDEEKMRRYGIGEVWVS